MVLSDGCLFVASTRGPLHLCAISRTGETVHSLNQQLRAVWSYLLFSTLPMASILLRLTSRPGLDIRPFCKGASCGLREILKASSRSPSIWLDAYPMAAIHSSIRSKAGVALSLGGADGCGLSSVGGRLLYSILLAGESIVSWCQPARQSGTEDLSLRPCDLHCILSFLSSSGSSLFDNSSDVWLSFGLPGLSTSGPVQALLRKVAIGGPLGVGGDSQGPVVRRVLSPLCSDCHTDSRNCNKKVIPPLNPCETRPSFLTLVLIAIGGGSSTGTEGVGDSENGTRSEGIPITTPLIDCLTTRAAKTTQSLLDAGVTSAVLKAVGASVSWDVAISQLHSSLGLPPPSPNLPSNPNALCLMHWVYCEKSSRQWSSCPSWPPGLSVDHSRRKSLLRAYSHLYSSVCIPPTRHALSAYSWPLVDGSPGGLRVSLVSAINSTNALVIAAWGFAGGSGDATEQGLPSDVVIALMEKLAKTLKLQNDRFFLLPGPPTY